LPKTLALLFEVCIRPVLEPVADDWARRFSSGADAGFRQYRMYWWILAASREEKEPVSRRATVSGQIYWL
jgi:hypothetical protein